MEHEIKITENYLYIGADQNDMLGYIKYYINRNGFIVATKTYVKPEERHNKLAYHLFLALIELAKKHDTKIMPYCSYIAHHLNRNEYKAFLA